MMSSNASSKSSLNSQLSSPNNPTNRKSKIQVTLTNKIKKSHSGISLNRKFQISIDKLYDPQIFAEPPPPSPHKTYSALSFRSQSSLKEMSFASYLQNKNTSTKPYSKKISSIPSISHSETSQSFNNYYAEEKRKETQLPKITFKHRTTAPSPFFQYNLSTR